MGYNVGMVYVVRDLEIELEKYLNAPEMLAVLGPRQCGKTTMLENMLAKQKSLGKKINQITLRVNWLICF